jgi:hypothetical protein
VLPVVAVVPAGLTVVLFHGAGMDAVELS